MISSAVRRLLVASTTPIHYTSHVTAAVIGHNAAQRTYHTSAAPASLSFNESLIGARMRARESNEALLDYFRVYWPKSATLGVPQITTHPDALTPKYMKNSRCSVTLPFSTDESLRLKYINTFEDLRYGLIMENIDAMAGQVAYMHTGRTNKLTIVTASIDRIDVLNKLPATNDVHLTGYVSYVGTSSMEITVTIDSLRETGAERVMNAYLLMVALDGVTHKATSVPPLLTETDEEREIIARGADRQSVRVVERTTSLLSTPPTQEEFNHIHEILSVNKAKPVNPAGHIDPATQRARNQANPAEHIDVVHTKFMSTHLMHPQERNLHGKIFGGHLMRVGFELAWMTAMVFAKQKPIFLNLDDTHFHKPVSIGSVLQFTSIVNYTEGRIAHVQIIAEDIKASSGTKQHTNTFNFAFGFAEDLQAQVVPRSYLEVVAYLQGRRIHATTAIPVVR